VTSDYFESLCKKLFSSLKPGEHLYVALTAESSQFIRINKKIRQIGTVSDANVSLSLVHELQSGLQKSARSLTLSGNPQQDAEVLAENLRLLQTEVRELPLDPYALLPNNRGQSRTEKKGNLLPIEEAPSQLTSKTSGMDIAGLYAAGSSIRAMADSSGTFHWFSAETFSFDHSVYTAGQRAVKNLFAGQNWDSSAFAAEIRSSEKKLALLERPARKLDRGGYRVFLEPAAFSDLVHMLSWGTIGEAAIQQGDSPLRRLRTEEMRLSPHFSVSEDFSGGESPRFNSSGELAPEKLQLFEAGVFKNSLISSRTAKEYKLTSNYAQEGEGLRAPSVAPGKLVESEILSRLHTGLYLSNLHYLNWSDHPGGRITGMTRYACFWVENGEMICPIENMRFDDTIFRFFGDSLEALTAQVKYLPDTGTYGMRSLGGITTPGALLSDMKFTL
jgi:predicted Zn-dependent protease